MNINISNYLTGLTNMASEWSSNMGPSYVDAICFKSKEYKKEPASRFFLSAHSALLVFCIIRAFAETDAVNGVSQSTSQCADKVAGGQTGSELAGESKAVSQRFRFTWLEVNSPAGDVFLFFFRQKFHVFQYYALPSWVCVLSFISIISHKLTPHKRKQVHNRTETIKQSRVNLLCQ